MKRDMTWLKQCCWTNMDRLQGPVRGVVLIFHGLNGGYRAPDIYSMQELEWTAAGALVVYPYYGPWSWMNRSARAFVDELVETLYREYGFDDSVPLISTGGSMGGCSALLYCRYAVKKPVAAYALFPVCDTAYHYTERPDLPTSMNHAFYGYPGTLAECLSEQSPLAQVSQMPDIPYLIIHGDSDKSVNKQRHSDCFVAAMRAAGRNVEYMEVVGMGHGSNMTIDVHLRSTEFTCSFLKPQPIESK